MSIDDDVLENSATVPRLNAWNPLHWGLLLGWMCFNPAQIKAHEAKYGYEAHEITGNWLANTLAWLPLFITTLGIAARPQLAALWNDMLGWSLPAPIMPLGVVLSYLLLTAFASFIPHQNETVGVLGAVVWVLIVGVLGAVTSALAGVMAGAVIFVMAFLMALGVAFVVAGVVTSAVGGAVAIFMTYFVALGMMLGVASAVVGVWVGAVVGVVASVAALIVAGGVMGNIKRSIQQGHATWQNYAILPVLLISYAILAWWVFTAPMV